jgi:Mrp family chromosome partitioning ATPase/capsular polysaccharide biosynthesis protein
MTEAFSNRPTTVADYLTILRRRKWMVVIPPVVAGVVAFFVASSQHPLYQASSSILVNRTSVVNAVVNISDPAAGDPTRFLTTQASIARSPELATRVVAAAGVAGISPGRLLSESSVHPSTTSDVLYVDVKDRSPAVATRLANAYASEFTHYKTELDTARINNALAVLKTRIDALRANGATASPAYASLVQTQGNLETIGKLLADNTSVLMPAGGAGKVSPRPKRDAGVGIAFGLVLGLALAFLAEALDRHIRTEHELERALRLPLLGRLPKPSRELQKKTDLVMLKHPASAEAEAFRKLRTSFEFINPAAAAKTIMVTSAVEQEGKSTTIANLAVALARSGRRVVLVDLDLRRPFLNRLFHTSGRPGITDVVMMQADLSDALRPIPLQSSFGAVARNGNRPSDLSNGRSEGGLLHLLPAGTIALPAGDLLQDARLLDVLDQVAGRFDLVLIDAPPLLAFDDAMILSAHVDAIFAITRLNRVQRPILHEFARQLHTCQANLLGYVLTGVEHSESYRYMYEAYAYEAREPTGTREPV